MRQMWNGNRWWKRGTEKTQKGIPLILIEQNIDLLFIIKAAAHVWPWDQYTGEKWTKN